MPGVGVEGSDLDRVTSIRSAAGYIRLWVLKSEAFL